MTTQRITRQEAEDALRRVINSKPTCYRNPDYSSNADGSGCRYSDPAGLPSCIIGNVLHSLGLPVPVWGGRANAKSFGVLRVARKFDEDAVYLLYDVQCKADNGATWRQAFSEVIS